MDLAGGFQVVEDDRFHHVPSFENYSSIWHQHHRKLDIMLGITSHEGAGFVHEVLSRMLGTDDNRQMKLVPSKDIAKQVVDSIVKMQVYRGKRNTEKIARAISERYLDCVQFDNREKLTKALVYIMSSIMFNIPLAKTAKTISGEIFLTRGND